MEQRELRGVVHRQDEREVEAERHVEHEGVGNRRVLTKHFLPSSWGNYTPTFWDWALYAGSFGLFGTLFFLFIRLLPAIATSEMKEFAHHDAHHGPDAYEAIREAYYRGEVRA